MKNAISKFGHKTFRSPPLSGKQVGWFRPAAAIMLALTFPALLALFFIYNGAPTFDGPPSAGGTYTLNDHIAIVLGTLAFSFLTSWMATPLILLSLRAAAMLGYAGWGTSVIAAWVIGLPIVHFALNGDLTTEEHAILPHMMFTIGVLGFCVWAAFWGLFALRRQSPDAKV